MLTRALARPFWPLALLVALAACQSTPPRPAARPVTFAQFGPIALDAASVGVVDARRPPAGVVLADDRSPVTPADAVKRWAAERLQAVGRAGRVQVTIRDASIIEVALPRTGGVRGYFTNDQAQRYDGRMEVEVSGERPGESTFRGVTRAVVTASTSVAENISLADRETVLQDLVRGMADDLNAKLDGGIRRDLAPMVVR